MASEKIFRSAVFGGFNRSDVISYIEDLRNEISDLQRKYADKETKINELEDKVGDLTEKCASLNDQEKYNIQCDTVEALKNENVELNNKVSELQSISDKYDESVSEFELKEQKIKTAEAQLGAAFLDARKYSDEIVSAANVKASDISAKASAEISEQAVEISKLTAEVNAISERFNRSIDELHSSIAALANKMSVSANELSKRKNAPSFVPDVSIKIDDENNITLQNTVDDNSKKIEDGFNLDSSTVFNFNKHKEG